jgi:hypothetical protein
MKTGRTKRRFAGLIAVSVPAGCDWFVGFSGTVRDPQGRARAGRPHTPHRTAVLARRQH